MTNKKSLEIKIINPLNFPKWNDLLLSNENHSFFHSSNWARVLYESYNYKPLYFAIIDNNKLETLMPFMEVKSILTGIRGVSLPFSDYCEPIIGEESHFQGMIKFVTHYGRKAGWKYIEWRGKEDYPREWESFVSYRGHVLELVQNEERLLSKFRSSTKRNITKAVKEGVIARISNSLGSMREFYRLHCMTRKKHGLPPQPYSFFLKIFEHVISKNHGLVVLASYDNKNIAGAVYFHSGKEAIYKYGASEENYQNLRANNLVMFEAISWYAQKGYERFCFGRTDPENKGLLQFKAGWGTTEQTIRYYKYDLEKDSFVREHSHGAELSNKIFNKMPIPLLERIGSLAYRHIG